MTANLFLRREIFMAVGGFDGLFDHPHFREDADPAWRALKHGAIPYAQDARVCLPAQPRNQKEGIARGNQFEKDALLLDKHPERYKTLFLMEGHYKHNADFRKNFLRCAEKYGVKIDEFYLSKLAENRSRG